MIPARIEGCTRALGAPRGWTPETSGECGALPIRDEMNGDMPCMTSAWEPTPDELAALNAGGKVYLRIVGQGHPPVWVYAMAPPEDQGADIVWRLERQIEELKLEEVPSAGASETPAQDDASQQA